MRMHNAQDIVTHTRTPCGRYQRLCRRETTWIILTMVPSVVVALAFFLHGANAFSSSPFVQSPRLSQSFVTAQRFNHRESQLNIFDKMFEESGPLGKGITVGKVQVALRSPDRGASSIFAILEEEARLTDNSSDPEDLASMANTVCLTLLRRSDDWVAAGSASQWFKQDDTGKAESLFNDWANREAAKFEKEYIPGAADVGGASTLVVISLVIEIMGDTTKFEGAGYSFSGTKDVLASIASDSLVDGGECVNAVELFWTPSAREEVLKSQDVILDFPELIDL